MSDLPDRPGGEGARVPLTDYGRRFEAAASSARAFIRHRYQEDGCVVGIGEVLEHLDEVFGEAAGLTSDVGTVLNLCEELWADPHIDQVPGGWIDFCWNEVGDYPLDGVDGRGLYSRHFDRYGPRGPQ